MKKIILLISLLSSYNLFAINLAVECNGCNASQSQQKAEQHASAIPRIGNIYLFNFTNHNLKKYFVYQESLLNSDDGSQKLFEKQNEVLKEYGITEDQIIDMFTGSTSQNNINSGTFAIIYEVTPTIQEKQSFDDIDEVINSFSPNIIIENIPSFYTNPQDGGGMIGNNFGVYDLIGNTSLSSAILSQFHSDNQIALAIFQFEQAVTSLFEALKLNWVVEFKLIMPDGSWGIAHFENGQLVFDETTFIDSDGNPVPVSSSDTSGRTYFFSGGQESSGFGGFTRRLTMLGVGYGSSSGGGSCTFRCSAQGCILTCKAN